MTPEEILALLTAMADDERSKILDSFKPKEPPKPAEPPKPDEPPKPAEPPKADSTVTMTAAEFMRFVEQMNKKKEEPKKEEEEEEDDAELYL